MSEEESVLCCVQIDDLAVPEPGSVRSVCQECEKPIWISLKGMGLIERQPQVRILCARCVLSVVDNFEQFQALPDEDRELREWFDKDKQRVVDLLKRRLDRE